jgi:glycosyltransferase involved in cell wall biosynthesis
MNHKNNIIVSIVITTRNEESNIASCIESAIKESKGIESEIILIDTESTDETIEIAKKYPISIFEIPYDKYGSPGAARFVGTKYSRGKYILFLDGDVILIKNWIKKAVSYFDEDNLAGVHGKLFNVYPNEKLNMNHASKHVAHYGKELGGGAPMYRRKALDQCGTFHPFLKGEEERELCHRLYSKGWKLRVVNAPMAFHLNKVKNKSEIDEKAGYFKGVGQILREYPFADMSKRFIASYRRVVLEIITIHSYLCVFILTLIFKEFLITYILSILLVIFILSFLKSPYKVYLYIRSRFLITWNVIFGFIIGLDNPDTYMKKIKVKTIK